MIEKNSTESFYANIWFRFNYLHADSNVLTLYTVCLFNVNFLPETIEIQNIHYGKGKHWTDLIYRMSQK